MKLKILYRYRDLELNCFRLKSVVVDSPFKKVFDAKLNLYDILPKKILELPKLYIRDILKIK